MIRFLLRLKNALSLAQAPSLDCRLRDDPEAQHGVARHQREERKLAGQRPFAIAEKVPRHPVREMDRDDVPES
jgi:hypothetical protein